MGNRWKAGVWIEAMRLRTLPVSVAGVVAGCAMAAGAGRLNVAVAAICLAFAVLAQIASNFANEYFDYKAGFDGPGRDGPRRGVSEGDISPRAMRAATLITLAVACALGCLLILYGGWWLLGAGAVIALGAMAYSAGPYPLSRHCLGEVAVVFFFGIVPVNLTYYVQALGFTREVAQVSVAFGLMGAMVLLCNNYRDMVSDRATGKHTLVTAFGRGVAGALYAAMGAGAALLLAGFGAVAVLPAVLGAVAGGVMIVRRRRLTGAECTPLLGITSMVMLVASVWLFIVAACV
ncbi:1,4-dihydroxy-2-naphthoate octaprenyltransferase [Paramuribaculum intestinale]|jgi:1,4-dihydroxy-2-naphthoate octaprenyltransferase|uniref:1,4-dihydroxy-2-naphthoate octaprenyltransferase n=1 Tax=Paramuribaculum intestinale TaxID=2094151 RepID=UPI0025A623E9|nr:1,4-dihydroxy-2-naphthoate octaprenyltransferase [Paramuribaculum intestinale]